MKLFSSKEITRKYGVKNKNQFIFQVCDNSLECLLEVKWMKQKSLSRVWLFAIPWTVAHQIPLSMEFSRQEY